MHYERVSSPARMVQSAATTIDTTISSGGTELVFAAGAAAMSLSAAAARARYVVAVEAVVLTGAPPHGPPGSGRSRSSAQRLGAEHR
jgi:cytosine/adenosine deaminase-related metal-dependent hydrolase